jgi:DNA-binding XRE family transcriptional regulator
MGDPVMEHVGGRIRLYRKKSGLSLEELAEKICKSKASVSKYEQGKVAVDVVTLFDIAAALNITPFQLFDYTNVHKQHNAETPFSKCDTMHLYHMGSKKVYHSLMKTFPDGEDGQIRATLFYKIKDTLNYGNCSCIYHGSMYSHELLLSFILQNYHNTVENILLNFSIPVRNAAVLTGMICGISANRYIPTAHKILLSKEELVCDEALEIGRASCRERV